MEYRYCGNSGIQLPVLSLGLWHNFGSVDDFGVATDMIVKAFDAGVCHFDLANNYGPVPGSAEENFGLILRENLRSHRDEIFISTKAGHEMWPGVYGNGSSRKNLIASCNQSLHRMGLDYVDVFYSHRYDGVTPIEETMQALVDIVRSGKALYAGISKYPRDLQLKCYEYLRAHDVPCLLSQYRASMFVREPLLPITDSDHGNTMHSAMQVAKEEGSGFIAFSPLAQGLLTDKYLKGIPQNSRAAKSTGFLQVSQVTPERIDAARLLNEIARRRGQSLAQMSLAWLLRHEGMTSVIIGTSSVAQLEDNLRTLDNLTFSEEELTAIDAVLSSQSL